MLRVQLHKFIQVWTPTQERGRSLIVGLVE